MNTGIPGIRTPILDVVATSPARLDRTDVSPIDNFASTASLYERTDVFASVDGTCCVE